MSIKGSPHARFRRALETGNPTLVLTAAAELGSVDLPDALAICLVLLEGGSARYDRAATRWLGRYCLEAPGLGLRDAALALCALDALRGDHGEAGAHALLVLFESGGRDDLVGVLGRWSARRGS